MSFAFSWAAASRVRAFCSLSWASVSAAPGETLPTRLLSLDPPGGAEALAASLRKSSPSVVGRIEEDCVLLDPRTVLPEQDNSLLAILTTEITEITEGTEKK